MNPDILASVYECKDSDALYDLFQNKKIPVDQHLLPELFQMVDLSKVKRDLRYFFFYMSCCNSYPEFIKPFYDPSFTDDELYDCYRTFMENSTDNLKEGLKALMLVFQGREDIDAFEILEDISQMTLDLNKMEADKMYRPDLAKFARELLADLKEQN